MSRSENVAAWSRLTAVATLGTNRAPLPAESIWPDASLASDTESAERKLLRAAAATHLWQLAGQRTAPAPSASNNDAPARDTQHMLSEPAAWRLARMINGEHRELIPEWLSLARSSGKTLPPHWLPVVLDALSAPQRNEASAVLGPTAQWLGSRNPNWALRPSAEEPSEVRWTDGTLEERRAELQAMREHDAAAARSWLQKTWLTDPPDAREEFLKILLIGLGPQDEPFLEEALEDKRKGVRLAAAEALARLPGSAHAKRNLDRLQVLLGFDEPKGGLLGKLRKRKLEVRLPEAPDKATLRDGIEAKPPAQRKIGERAFWLMQMVAMAPPRHWCERFNCDAETFLQAALATEYAADLLSALSAAVARHPDSEWSSSLCNAWLNQSNEPQITASALAALITSTAAAERLTLLHSVLSEARSRRPEVLLLLLSSVELQWNPPITALAMNLLEGSARKDTQNWSHARNLLDSWAIRCDVATAVQRLPDMFAQCPEKSPWRNALEQLNDNVDFRAAMRKELLK